MTKKVINHVQDYLTVVGEDKVYQIVNVELLLSKTPPGSCNRFSWAASQRISKRAGTIN